MLSMGWLMGCASSGIIQTGPDSYTVSKTSAGGGFVSGASVKADLLKEAGAYCAQRGQVIETTSETARDAVPFAHMPSAEVKFHCVATQAKAASGNQ